MQSLVPSVQALFLRILSVLPTLTDWINGGQICQDNRGGSRSALAMAGLGLGLPLSMPLAQLGAQDAGSRGFERAVEKLEG